METKLIVDAETGNIEEVKLTAKEIADRKIEEAAFDAKIAQEEADRIALENKKQAVLAKLGLTAEEVSALLA